MALLHICAYPGCQEAIPLSDKYCARHKEKRRVKNRRRNAKQGGRDSKAPPLNVAMVLSGGSAERHS